MGSRARGEGAGEAELRVCEEGVGAEGMRMRETDWMMTTLSKLGSSHPHLRLTIVRSRSTLTASSPSGLRGLQGARQGPP